MYYQDRQDAGKRLAEQLIEFINNNPLVLTIPRGGVLVAKEVAEYLKSPLDLIIPRKIGAPVNPELAIGAVTQDGTILLNDRLVKKFNITNQEVLEEAELLVQEIKRRIKEYRGSTEMPEIKGRTVILVDDGIATGFTIKAALLSIKNYEPREIILAVPVATPKVLESLAAEVDKIICLYTPEDFFAVGQFYEDFEQVSDDEVKMIMQSLREKSTQR